MIAGRLCQLCLCWVGGHYGVGGPGGEREERNGEEARTTVAPQGLAKGVQSGKHSGLQPQTTDHAASFGAVDACRVRLVDDHVPVAPRKRLLDQVHDFGERREVAIHGVQALHRHENTPRGVPVARIVLVELLQQRAQGMHTVVLERHRGRRTGQPHALVHAGVDELVVDQHIPRLRHTGEEAGIGVEARVEQQPGGGVVEGGDVALQPLGVRRVAVQQARAPAAQAETARVALALARALALQLGGEGGVEAGRGGEGEEVVEGEVDGGGGGGGEGAESGSASPAGQLAGHGLGQRGLRRGRHLAAGAGRRGGRGGGAGQERPGVWRVGRDGGN